MPMIFFLMDIVKWLLIPFAVMGFSFKRSKENCFLLVFIYALYIYWRIYEKEYACIINAVFPFVTIYLGFAITWKQAIKVFLLEELCMMFADAILLLAIIGFTSWEDTNAWMEIVSHTVSIILWFVIAVPLGRIRGKINEAIKAMRIRELLLFVVGMGSLVIIVSSIRNGFTGKMVEKNKIPVIAGMIFCLLLLALTVMFFYVLASRKKLQQLNDVNAACIKFQKDYYEGIIKFDEEMRAFRHDVNKHYRVLSELIKEEHYQDARHYLESIIETKDVNYVYRTGNVVADYIINGKIADIKESMEVDVKVVGTFPQSVQIDQADLCILMDNALDNAKEALEKVQGNKELQIIIKNFQDNIYLTFINSSNSIDVGKLETSKKDTVNHGYGLGNIKRVLQKNGGSLQISYHSGKFYLEAEW